jgi:hypothetical protein
LPTSSNDMTVIDKCDAVGQRVAIVILVGINTGVARANRRNPPVKSLFS